MAHTQTHTHRTLLFPSVIEMLSNGKGPPPLLLLCSSLCLSLSFSTHLTEILMFLKRSRSHLTHYFCLKEQVTVSHIQIHKGEN